MTIYLLRYIKRTWRIILFTLYLCIRNKIVYLRPAMALFYYILYDMSRHAPHMNVEIRDTPHFQKLLTQGNNIEYLKSSFKKFYGRYGDLNKQYEVSLSRMFNAILKLDHIHWHSQPIRHFTNPWPWHRFLPGVEATFPQTSKFGV